ncbi:hypothetical protein HPP92_018858 [Vanilla planifolia]|uniref:Fe2OG dioxygenase domain-containing protein n=1 Tax=Vanilla planifolia TaxID=51239 RepID=A0A835Q9K8_VANPL|nr:hypothetical protein HPP92_018858 [Vanilla planifolia]
MAVETISLPSIDLTNFPAELRKLTDAATGLGCFRVVNHGIPVELMTEAKATVSSFSKLPDNTKLRNHDVIYGSGFRSPRDFMPLLETFGIYDAASTADVLAFCSSMEASPHQREVLSTYARKVHSLAVDIALKMVEGLGLVGCSFQDWPCNMRLNVYDFTEESIGRQAVHAHTDSGLLTLLLEGEIGGFEIADETGKFVAVDPQPGTFLGIIGDVGKAWSNGRLRNVQHRVICTQVEPRVSIDFIMVSPRDGLVEPQAALVDDEHPQLYQSFTITEYRELRITDDSLVGNALPLWQADE